MANTPINGKPCESLTEKIVQCLNCGDSAHATWHARSVMKLLESASAVSLIDVAATLQEIACLFELHSQTEIAAELRSIAAAKLKAS
jgi:hypothetical protein